MLRRKFLALASTAASATALAACAGTSSTNSQGGNDKGGDGEVTELTWWSCLLYTSPSPRDS